MIAPPRKGEDCRKLHRIVDQCAEVLGAVANMTALVDGKVHYIGKVDINGDTSTLRLFQIDQNFIAGLNGLPTGGGPGGKSNVTVSLTSSKNPSNFNDSITFTATISDSTATGTVQFLRDGINIGSPVSVSGGQATSTAISTLTVGSHNIAAQYSGDTNFNAASGSLTQTVGQVPTDVLIYGTPNPYTDAYGGQSPAFTIYMEVQNQTGQLQTGATGTFLLRFSSDGGATFGPVSGGNAIAIHGGIATFPTYTPSGATFIFRAFYSGDTNYAATQAGFPGQYTEVWGTSGGGGPFPTNFTLTGPGSTQLGVLNTYTIGAANNFTGQVEIWVPGAFCTEYYYGGTIAWSGTPQVSDNSSNYPIVVNMVNGAATFQLIVRGGVAITYSAGDNAQGYVDLSITSPSQTSLRPTINGSSAYPRVMLL